MKRTLCAILLASGLLVACSGTKKVAEDASAKASQEVTTSQGQAVSVTPEAPTPPAPPKPPTLPKKPKTMLVGQAERQELQQAPFASWFTPNYERYTVNVALLPKITEAMKGVEVRTFMGTWCGDSKRETPRFYKIMDAASVAPDALELITVNRGKRTPDGLTEGQVIIRVPTFIFLKNGEELGRIVERPVESLEADMLKILTNQPYSHAYEDN